MATMRDLEQLALELPETAKELDEDGRVRYLVNGKWFVFHRKPRKDAPFDDVLVFRIEADAKELALADPRGIWFTTPHWHGFPAVLMRIPQLKQLRKAELRDAVVDAWLTKAPRRVARAYLDATS